MKKVLASAALALSVSCFLEGPSAKAQEFFFPNAYSRPTEEVEGIDVGRRVDATDIFAPTRTALAQNRHGEGGLGRGHRTH
jgi:hypothetical protein